MRYSKLTINLDGDLAGEFVAGIELDGIARDPALTTVATGSGISGLVARRALASSPRSRSSSTSPFAGRSAR
jgi:hypothetical protein